MSFTQQFRVRTNSSANPDFVLPRSIAPLFAEFGKNLRSDEWINVCSPDLPKPARYDHQVQQELLRLAAASYEDEVDLTGEVRGTDLDGLRFALRLADGRKIPARFASEQEAIILAALGEHANMRLHIIGTGQFAAESGELEQVNAVDHIELLAPEPDSSAMPIWERITRAEAADTGEGWSGVPSDLAENVDLYLYGKKLPN